MTYDNIIAIDPDVAKSGVAHLQTSTRKLEDEEHEQYQLAEHK